LRRTFRELVPAALPAAKCRTRLSCQTDIFAEQLADIFPEQ
jgi:hypothetical protein